MFSVSCVYQFVCSQGRGFLYGIYCTGTLSPFGIFKLVQVRPHCTGVPHSSLYCTDAPRSASNNLFSLVIRNFKEWNCLGCKLYSVLSAGQSCQDPGEVAGATRDVTRGPYPIGTEIRYHCILGAGGTITCQTGGQWTQKPACTPTGMPGMNCNFFV